VCSPIVARQRLGEHVPAATNTQATKKIVGRVVFYTVRVMSEGSRRLALPRSSCVFSIFLWLKADSWALDNWGIRVQCQQIIFLLQTGFRAHSASYLMGTVCSQVKRPWRYADHSLSSSAEVKNMWSNTSTPSCVFFTWCLIKNRDNFTPYFQPTWNFIFTCLCS
jgi:hypothetical protein